MREFRFPELSNPCELISAVNFWLCLEYRVREMLMELKLFGIGMC